MAIRNPNEVGNDLLQAGEFALKLPPAAPPAERNKDYYDGYSSYDSPTDGDHHSMSNHTHLHEVKGAQTRHSHGHKHQTGNASHDDNFHTTYYHDAPITNSKEATAPATEESTALPSQPDASAQGAVVVDTLTVSGKLARAKMPESQFAYVDSKGGKHLPIHDADHVRAALARFNQTQFESDSAKKAAKSKIKKAAKRLGVTVGNKSVMSKLAEALGFSNAGAAATTLPVKQPLGLGLGLKVVKQADGQLRWFSRFSNAWEDRDNEIITEAAHKEYVDWAYKSNAFPELWLWHTKGTRFGQADWLEFSDGFAHASGTIDDTPEARAVLESLSGKEVGVSHGFLSAQDGKHINKYRTFEISVLPIERAAVWTSDFNVIGKETMMGFTKDKRDFLVSALGEDTVAALEKNTAETAEQLKQLGVDYKSTEAASATTAKAPEAPTEAESAAYKALAGTMADMSTAMLNIATAVGALQKDITAVKATKDEQIGDAFLAKVSKAIGGSGFRPTESASTVVDEAEVARVKAAEESYKATGEGFFADAIFKQLGGAMAGVPAGIGEQATGAVTVR